MHVVAAGQPARGRVPDGGRAGRGGIAGPVGAGRQRGLDHGRDRVYRGADGQVDNAVRVGAGLLRGGREGVPGKHRQPGGDAADRPGGRSGGRSRALAVSCTMRPTGSWLRV